MTNEVSLDLPADLPQAYRSGGRGSLRRQSVSAEVVSAQARQQLPAPRYPKSEAQVADLKAAVQDNFLFEGLTAKQLHDVFNRMFECRVRAGEEVMVQGQEGDNFYVITSGILEAVKDGQVVCRYEGRGSFGELALMYNSSRAATVVAVTDGVLWALDRRSFADTLIADRQRRAGASDTWLGRVPILDYLSRAECAKLADALTLWEYADGATVFDQGADGDRFFIVEEGEALCTFTAADGSRKEVAHMREGDYFGERALITDEPRALTVTAHGALKVLSLDAPAFERLLGPCKHAMKTRIAAYESLVRHDNGHGEQDDMDMGTAADNQY